MGHADDGAWQMAWIDTWHNGSSIMFCTGTTAIDLTGSYGAPDQRLGWRTTADVSAADLVISAWNVTPPGESAKATKATYRRSA